MGLNRLNQESQGFIYGTRITKLVYIIQSTTMTDVGVIVYSNVLDREPKVLRTMLIVRTIKNVKRT